VLNNFNKYDLRYPKPDSGDILFKDVKYSAKTLRNVRASISYISQDVDLDEQNVFKLIVEILSYKVNSHISYKQDEIINYLRLLELDDDILIKNIKELFGVERQRIGLIIAFLLDEKL